MNKKISKPLITFMIIGFNQERFIREAIYGAFSQTYEPLEIILSDDCSTDDTFEIMKKMANLYSGPHKIILNKNKHNLGIGRHINKVMSLSKGEIIVAAAGDDISIPERTISIYKAWEMSNRKAFSIDSECEIIDENGIRLLKELNQYEKREKQLINFTENFRNLVLGSTHAWHRDVFKIFGPLPGIIQEDITIPPRSMLLGEIHHINKPLVKYRVHSSNICSIKKISGSENIIKSLSFIKDIIIISYDLERCILKHKKNRLKKTENEYLDKCLRNVFTLRNKEKLKVMILSSPPIIRLLYYLKFVIKYGFNRKDKMLLFCAISKHSYILYKNLKNVMLVGLMI